MITCQSDPGVFSLLPDMESGAGTAVPVLAARLSQLLTAAGCLHLSVPDVGGMSLSSELDALRGAAQGFMTDAGLALGEVLWTRLSPLFSGEMSERLVGLSRTTGKRIDEALLVLIAQGAGPRALVFGSSSPLVVRGGIEGAFAAGGPFVALVHCRLDAMSRLEASGAFVYPVLDHRRLVPITTDFERDIVRVLLALQDRLDDHGCRCTIDRTMENGVVRAVIDVSVTFPDGGRISMEVVQGDTYCAQLDKNLSGRIVASPQSLRDGSFVASLEALLAVSGTGKADEPRK